MALSARARRRSTPSAEPAEERASRVDDRFEAYRDALKQGHLAAQRNKYKDALKHYQAAARLADERAQPHVNAGSVLLRMGKPKDAVAAYERAAERAPD